MRPDARGHAGEKRAAVRRMFDGIAGTYDLLNHLLSAGLDILWRRRAIDALRLLPGARVLDLATGTGDVGIEAARRGLQTRVVGVDPSMQMLRRGAAKAGKRPGRMVFCGGEAEHLPFADRTFDRIAVGFGIRNVANLNASLREMRRVLRPTGRVVILEFSRPHLSLLRSVYLLYFRYALPGVGRMVSRNPNAYRYLYESVMAFPGEAEFCRHLARAGFANVTARRLTFGIVTLYVTVKHKGGRRVRRGMV